MYRTLLAKGWSTEESAAPPSHARLVPHLRAVEAAGEAMVESRGAVILQNLGLDNEAVWLPRLRLALSLAAVLHDLGKANSFFQGMVRGKAAYPPQAQPIRHELVTALLLLRNSGGLADWLRARIDQAGQSAVREPLFQTVVGAVAGHHLKMDSDWSEAFRGQNPIGGGTTLALFLGHPDLRSLFDQGWSPGDETWSLLRSDRATYPGRSQFAFNAQSVAWQDFLARSPEWWRFAAAVKALTVAADVAGSALLPEGVGVRGWVRDALSGGPTGEQLNAVVAARLRGHTVRPFQRAIAESTPRVTLVEAGCGSGKTAAAYLWAARRAPGRKLFFCYPTTGTATEGFLGYVHESEVEAQLLHSRAAVDLERVTTTQEQEGEEEQLRVSSLSAWGPEVVVCTVDTVLALVRNNRRGLYGSPTILSGAFVLDEVHAYDDEMFAAVLALIRALPGAPFLLMSASLPAGHKDLLRKTVGELGEVYPPAELEAIPRYRIQWAEGLDAAFEEVAEQLARGARVLWVCNTVARAQALFDRAREAGLPAVTYHSRFKYRDRVDRHRQVVDAFASPPGASLLAVTTQVAEMSLDLDADLLVSELAPVPALIQRLGRLNRRVTENQPGSPRLALVLRPGSDLPYTAGELADAEAWVDRLLSRGRPLSQQDLAEEFRQQAGRRPLQLELRTEWLDSGWLAKPGMVREPGFTVSVILAEDADACRASAAERVRRSLPVPYRAGMDGWPRVHGTLVAPSDVLRYDAERGAAWAD